MFLQTKLVIFKLTYPDFLPAVSIVIYTSTANEIEEKRGGEGKEVGICIREKELGNAWETEPGDKDEDVERIQRLKKRGKESSKRMIKK